METPFYAAVVAVLVAACDAVALPYVNTGGTRLNIEALAAGAGNVHGGVGHDHYMQIAGGQVALYDKLRGRLQFGPIPVNTLFADGPRACRRFSKPDAHVMYDHLARRWVVSFRAAGNEKRRRRYYQCIAVSATADGAGAYVAHALEVKDRRGRAQDFDNPQLALWPDAYYLTLNLVDGRAREHSRSRMCGVDRLLLIAGRRLSYRCSDVSAAFGRLQAASFGGHALPPAGAGIPVFSLGAGGGDAMVMRYSYTRGQLSQWQALAVEPYAGAAGPALIRQPAPAPALPLFASRIGLRATYRHGHGGGIVVATHSIVLPDGAIGVRWYQIGLAPGDATLIDQGTIATAAESRWMGHIGIDKAGNIAIGYNVASADTPPGFRYTGREASDAPGVMHNEEVIVNGTGVQTDATTIAYATGSMALDPVDDCTFWATQRYIPVSGMGTWRTRIASFRFRSCL